MNKNQRELYGNNKEKLQAFKGRLLRLRSFKNLKPEAKRVAIAQDVIAQLDLEKIVPSQGTWLETLESKTLFTDEDVKKNKLLSGKLAKVEKCEACALGSMFMCAVDLAKDLRCKEVENEISSWSNESTGIQLGSMEPYLGKFFDQDQLRLIELAFEGGDGGYDPETKAEKCASIMFNENDEAESRMRTIMQNIIDNKGTFVVEVTDAILAKYDGEDYEDNYDDDDVDCDCSDCTGASDEDDEDEEEEESCSDCGEYDCEGLCLEEEEEEDYDYEEEEEDDEDLW